MGCFDRFKLYIERADRFFSPRQAGRGIEIVSDGEQGIDLQETKLLRYVQRKPFDFVKGDSFASMVALAEEQ